MTPTTFEAIPDHIMRVGVRQAIFDLGLTREEFYERMKNEIGQKVRSREFTAGEGNAHLSEFMRIYDEELTSEGFYTCNGDEGF